jgi:hypothetical protein
MEPTPRENPNPSSPHEDRPNPNLDRENIKFQIDARLRSLRTLIQYLRNTRVPSRISLATSLDTIVTSIANSQGQLSHISYYRARMFDYYRTSLDRNQVRDLKISKQDFMTLLIVPRTITQPPITKKCICMNWCTYQHFALSFKTNTPLGMVSPAFGISFSSLSLS